MLMENQGTGARLVTAAMLGLDGETVLVGGHVYFIQPPTIKKIVGCGHYLAGFHGEENLGDYLNEFKDFGDVCKALSWLIAGDESKTGELMEGTLEEVVHGIEVGIALIGTKNFPMLSVLSKNVSGLIAKPRQ